MCGGCLDTHARKVVGSSLHVELFLHGAAFECRCTPSSDLVAVAGVSGSVGVGLSSLAEQKVFLLLRSSEHSVLMDFYPVVS